MFTVDVKKQRNNNTKVPSVTTSTQPFLSNINIGVGRGGGGAIPFAPPPPPPIIHPHFPSISMWNRKNHKCTKLKGKIIINVTLICFEGTCKIIPFKSILEFSILSDFQIRYVIIWHWFIKNLVGTWRRNDVDATSLRRIDVSTMPCACCEFAPPPPLAPQYSKPS